MQRILVIDDSEDVRSLVSDLLSSEYEVWQAQDGAVGLNMALEAPPDLILCDIKMPKLDGYATLAALRNDIRTAKIPFLFISGASEKPRVRLGLELGADGYLTKPFSFSDLFESVRSALESSTATRGSPAGEGAVAGTAEIHFDLPRPASIALNHVAGFAGILADQGQNLPRAEVFDFANRIRQSGYRLERQLRNLYLYSQLISLGPEKLRPWPKESAWDVNKTVSELAGKVAQHHEREEDLDLQLSDGETGLPQAPLRHILGELLEDAFQRSDAPTKVLLKFERNGAMTSFTVHSFGRGMMPPEISALEVEVPFDQAVHETTPGLGLRLAKRLTGLAGGSFRVMNQERGVTEIRLEFVDSGGK